MRLSELVKIPPRLQTRDVPALSMRAAVSSVDDERRTVEVTWTTGAKVLRNSWFDGPSYEELSMNPAHVRMGRLTSGKAPLLADHRASIGNVIGVVESARLDGNRGVATVRFAKAEDDPAADQIYRKIKDGIIASVSVGYRTYKSEKVETGSATIPTFRAVDWEPHELSAVALPADAGAEFRSDDQTKFNQCVFVTRGVDAVDEEAKKAAELKAKQEAEAAAQRDLETKSATERAVKLERERASGIRSAVRAAKLDDAFAAKLIDDGVELNAARAQVLDALATRSESMPPNANGSHFATTERGEDDREAFARGVTDALLSRGGNRHVAQAIERKVKGFENIGDGGQYRGMRLTDLARICARRAGVKGIDSMYSPERLVELALSARSGYGTPSDFPVLMEDIARKSMRAGYAVQPESWRRWVGVDSVSNFLDSSRFLKGSFGGLPVVPADAEYENVAIPDGAKNVINTETRGGIIAIGRHMIVNDDLGAFTNLASEFGASAGLSIELACYEALALNSGLGPTMADSSPFFDNTARANVSTGAALSGAALSLDRAHMRKQLDVSGNHALDLVPRILLIALPLEDAAKSINNDQFEQLTANTFAKQNQMKGMFVDIVTKPMAPVLTGTKRYLFTEAKEAFKVVFLDGSGEGPTLSSQEGFRRDGMEFKARIDFKVNAYDPKAAVYNAGQ